MTGESLTRRAALTGRDRPFGAEITQRLEAAGFVLAADVDGAQALDALVVNAPPQPSETRFRDLSDAGFLAALDGVLLEPAAICREALPRMNRDASIVLVSSRAHLGGWAGADVIAAGASLVGLARSLALELGERGIRVNLMAPDFVERPWDTPVWRGQVADVAAWLAGPASAGVSGETVLIDCARSLRMTESARR